VDGDVTDRRCLKFQHFACEFFVCFTGIKVEDTAIVAVVGGSNDLVISCLQRSGQLIVAVRINEFVGVFIECEVTSTIVFEYDFRTCA
jgi:transcription elongation factor